MQLLVPPVYSVVLTSGLFLFVLGFVSLTFHQRNLIMTLIALEILLLGLGILFLLFSYLTTQLTGLVVLFVLLTLGGAESAIGLTLLMVYYHIRQDIRLDTLTDLKF